MVQTGVLRLRALAPAKVNLSLFLGGLRSDGRHQLVTVFESLSLADQVSLVTEGDRDEVICAGVDGPNLAMQALEQLRLRGWAAPPVRIEIDKRIPIAAGMAGGSADAAAMLRLAAEIAPGRPEEVAAIAASLGADVPSQLTPGLVLGTGAGDMVEPLLPIAEHAVVVLPLPAALSTADVYREADRLGLIRQPAELESWRERIETGFAPGERPPDSVLVNDLEPAAVSLCPGIREALEAALDAGAEHSLVCGSGPTVGGLFWGRDSRARAREAADRLAARFPGATAAVPVQAEYGIPVFA